MILSLYSSRLVLEILGASDFGIYTLVAGVVTLLSFLTNSLTGSTQRYLSVGQGKKDQSHLKEIFSNSLALHIIIGLAIVIVLAAFTPLLFNGFLNIPAERIPAAKILYWQVVIMVYMSFVTSPFKALLISRENIVFSSVVEVIDAILKVILVIILGFASYNQLLWYGWIMFSIQLLNLVVYSSFCLTKYKECIFPRYHMLSWRLIKQMSGYTGWMIYSSACIAGRNQGLAIVLNKILGTAINAAYGIGMQIANMIAFVSTSFTNAVSPQLMAAEGRKDNERLWLLAHLQCKVSYLLMACLGIPTMFEMSVILRIWLVEVPAYTVQFSCMFICMQIVDMLTTGLALVNRAKGNIGMYTLVTYTPRIAVLPIAFVLLKDGYSIMSVVILMISVESLCMLLRLIMIRKLDGFNSLSFIRNILLRSQLPIIVGVLVCTFVHVGCTSTVRFFLTYILCVPTFIASTYYLAFNKSEKDIVASVLSGLKKRHSNKYH